MDTLCIVLLILFAFTLLVAVVAIIVARKLAAETDRLHDQVDAQQGEIDLLRGQLAERPVGGRQMPSAPFYLDGQPRLSLVRPASISPRQLGDI